MDVKGHTSKTDGRRVDVDCASQDVDVNTRHEDVQSARKAEEAQNELDQMSVHARKAIRAATKRLVRWERTAPKQNSHEQRPPVESQGHYEQEHSVEQLVVNRKQQEPNRATTHFERRSLFGTICKCDADRFAAAFEPDQNI